MQILYLLWHISELWKYFIAFEKISETFCRKKISKVHSEKVFAICQDVLPTIYGNFEKNFMYFWEEFQNVISTNPYYEKNS